MRKYLLPDSGSFYKANLHTHTTVSDGKLTPEEMKKAYMEQGYSIIAFTDHEVLVPHPELAEENFLPLNGYEVALTETGDNPWRYKKTCHICLVALEPDNLKHVCKHRSNWPGPNSPMTKYRDQMQFLYEDEPDFERQYTPEHVNEIMKRARENGFFVTYNHPTWSLENYNDYTNYHGMHAMEICNYGCVYVGFADYNEREYDDMLMAGERIFCISTDDNHNTHGLPGDSFGGFTMIKADKLEYKVITSALVAGHFYASQGPQIFDLWFEDSKIHIRCSDAQCIALTTGARRAKAVYADASGFLNEAEFEVMPEDRYIRITVTDPTGKHANTNAYFTDELY